MTLMIASASLCLCPLTRASKGPQTPVAPTMKSSVSNTALLDAPTSLRSRDRYIPTPLSTSLSSERRRSSELHDYHRRGIHSMNALHGQCLSRAVGTAE